MSSRRQLIQTGVVAVASLLAAAAAPKDSKTAKKPAAGVSTPGVQIPFAQLKPEIELKLEGPPSGLAFTTELFLAAGDRIERVNARTNKTGAAITGATAARGGLLNAFGHLWTVRGDGTLVKFDAKDGKEKAAIPAGAVAAPSALAATGDSVWVLADDKTSLLRVDPKENLPVADLRLPEACTGILAAESSLWVACPKAGRVLRINPATNLVDKWIDIAGEPYALTSGAGSLWVLASKEGTVVQIDPKTNKTGATVELKIPNATGSLAFGDGFVWASAPGFPVMRIETGEKPKLAQQFYGDSGALLFSGLNSLWIANPAAKTVTRFDPKRVIATLAE